ncbi:MAG: hypothetical protein ACLS9P_05320 [Haemophilus parainfluenzae]
MLGHTLQKIDGKEVKGYKKKAFQLILALKPYGITLRNRKWRWHVPFYVRTGKRLPACDGIVIHFKTITPCISQNAPENKLIIRTNR